MITINELCKTWDSIPKTQEGYKRIASNKPVSFHIGYNKKGQRCFYLMDIGKQYNLSSSKAIEVECLSTMKKDYSIRFVLHQNELEELFIKLCWDLISVSENATDPVLEIVNRYLRWMKMLQKIKEHEMGSSQIKGLMGELLYLEDLISSQDESVIYNWVGPEGADQDFIFNAGWSEVKAVGASAVEVSISSIQQLDRSDEGKLVVYSLDKVPVNGKHVHTLPQIISRIKSMIYSDIVRDEFDCKLTKYGYLKKDKNLYEDKFYRLSEHRVYRVDSNFPKITKSSIPVQIKNAKYSLDLAAIDNYRI